MADHVSNPGPTEPNDTEKKPLQSELRDVARTDGRNHDNAVDDETLNEAT